MKWKLVMVVPVALIAGLALYQLYSYAFEFGGIPIPVDSSFTTRVFLRYHYAGKAIDTEITDTGDVKALKEMLNGWSMFDGPSCGFDNDISLTLTNGQKSITLCPACDSCGTVRVGDSHRYFDISDEERKRLEKIVGKYGMIFPCE